MSTTHLDGSPDLELEAQMKECSAKVREQRKNVLEDRRLGEEALRRLLPIARRDTGQSRRVAAILLSLYNGHRFPLDMTNLRSLDYEIMEDCLAVIRMDSHAYQEVHRYFENGGQIFEQLAEDWGFNKREGGV